MKKVLIGLAVVVALVATMAGIGAAMERDHVSTRTAVISEPPDAVFTALTDVEAYPSWRSDVQSIAVAGRDPLRSTTCSCASSPVCSWIRRAHRRATSSTSRATSATT